MTDKPRDLYKEVAAAIFKVPVDQVTKEQRETGKNRVLAMGFSGYSHEREINEEISKIVRGVS